MMQVSVNYARLVVMMIISVAISVQVWPAELLSPLSSADTISHNNIYSDSLKTVLLEEIEVNADLVKRDGNKEVYKVTKSMRENTHNAGELLGKIPGILYNPLSTDILFKGSKNVIVIVDGVEKDEAYIKRLRPDRFESIEITDFPVGLYDGYDAVINLRTKRSYAGYEGLLLGEVGFSTGERNGVGNELRNSREAGQFTYTRDKINIDLVAGHSFGQQGLNEYYTKEYPLNGLMETTMQTTSKHPNKYIESNRSSVDLALDYDFNDRHSVSAKFSVTPSDQSDRYDASIRQVFTEGNRSDTIHEKRNIDDKNRVDILTGIWYRGTVANWDVKANATYTSIGFDRNRRIEKSSGYDLIDDRKIKSGYFSGGITADRYFNDRKWQVSLAEYVIFSNYKEQRRNSGATLSESNDFRNAVNVSIQHNVSKRLVWSANVGVSVFRNSWENLSSTHTTPKLGLMIMWSPSSKATVRFNYNLLSSYPALSSLQDYGQFVDSLMYSSGNPKLKTELDHELSLSGTFFDCLSVEGRWRHSENSVSSYYSAERGLIPSGVDSYYTKCGFVNGSKTTWSVNVTFGKALGKHWQVSMTGTARGYVSKYKHSNSSRILPEYSWYLVYRILNGDLQFYLSGYMDSYITITPQTNLWGHIETNALAVSKTFLDGRLQLMGMWTLPFSFSNGKAHGGVTSESYSTRYWADNQYRNYNTLRFTAVYMFNGGVSVKKYTRENQTIEL